MGTVNSLHQVRVLINKSSRVFVLLIVIILFVFFVSVIFNARNRPKNDSESQLQPIPNVVVSTPYPEISSSPIVYSENERIVTEELPFVAFPIAKELNLVDPLDLPDRFSQRPTRFFSNADNTENFMVSVVQNTRFKSVKVFAEEESAGLQVNNVVLAKYKDFYTSSITFSRENNLVLGQITIVYVPNFFHVFSYAKVNPGGSATSTTNAQISTYMTNFLSRYDWIAAQRLAQGSSFTEEQELSVLNEKDLQGLEQ